ncbi:MAG: hypothetical protein HY390_01945 [Deltaproteobacteria bacterium]|nr:hypothetical protein [Deltaproteobacteria bacterium]
MDKDQKKAEVNEDAKFGDIFKKAFYTGFGALFMTEAAIRSTFSELRLPQDVLKSVLSQAQKGKEEVFAILRSELANVFSKINVSKEMEKFLERHEMHVHIEFKAKTPRDPSRGEG